MKTIPDTSVPTAGAREAPAALDGDREASPGPGAPPDSAWRASGRAALAAARASLEAHPFLSAGVALAIGFLVGRAMAGRSS